MLIEMNNQIARLLDFNRSLQDQLTSANLKIVFLVKKQTTEIQEYQASKYSPCNNTWQCQYPPSLCQFFCNNSWAGSANTAG